MCWKIKTSQWRSKKQGCPELFWRPQADLGVLLPCQTSWKWNKIFASKCFSIKKIVSHDQFCNNKIQGLYFWWLFRTWKIIPFSMFIVWLLYLFITLFDQHWTDVPVEENCFSQTSIPYFTLIIKGSEKFNLGPGSGLRLSWPFFFSHFIAAIS